MAVSRGSSDPPDLPKGVFGCSRQYLASVLVYSEEVSTLVHSKEFSLLPLKSELKNQLPVPSCVLAIATAIQRVRITYVDVPEPMAVSLGSPDHPDLPKCDFGSSRQ